MLDEWLLEETFCVDICEFLEELGCNDEDVVFLTGLPVCLDEDLGVGIVGEEFYCCDCVAAEGIVDFYCLEEGD